MCLLHSKHKPNLVNESDYCLTPSEQCFSYTMARRSFISMRSCFVLDQNAKMDFYSASSLKQQSMHE